VKDQRYISTLRQYASKVPDIVAEQLTVYQKLLRPDKPEIQYVPIKNVKILFNRSELSNESEVDEYIQKFKEEMVRHIQQNRRIKL
jgi:hypothetical protein